MRPRSELMTRLATRPAAIRAAIGVSLSSGPAFLAAAPVLADGGPHVRRANSGAPRSSADGCAGCHRAHTGRARASSPRRREALCLACHGAAGTGATTDVESGVQYALGGGRGRKAVLAGALRSGGFLEARIDSATRSRISYPRLVLRRSSDLVLGQGAACSITGQPVDIGAPAPGRRDVVAAPGIAWGNGGTGTAVGASRRDLGCTSCHNPHGNGKYRILNPIPGDGTGAMVEAGTDATVTDAALPTGSDAIGTRNYTVQWGRTLADVLAGT